MVRPHQYVWVIGLGLLLGVALGSHFELPFIYLVTALILAVVGVTLRTSPPVFLTSLFLLVSLLGWWRCQSIMVQRPNVSQLNQTTAELAGRVVSDPDIIGNQQRFHFQIDRLDEQSTQLKVSVTSWHLPRFHYADQLSGRFELALPQDSQEFQYSNYLAKSNIYLTARQAGEITIIPAPPTILGALYQMKRLTNSAIHRFLPEPHAGLLSGLLLGIRTDLSDSFKTALQYSGTSHIIALSGFNVTIIINFLLSLLSWLLPRRWVWLIASMVILGFVVMTGASSSVVRAAIMGWVLLIASFWGRKHYSVNAVLLAALTMVILHPLILIYDVGFQLSVAATLGLIYGAELLRLKIWFIPKFILDILIATFGATLFTLPLVAFYFGGVSWVALGANLLVVPLIPYLMLVGSIGLIGFVIWPALHWLSILVWPLSSLLITVINWFGSLPSAFILAPSLPAWVPVTYYIILGIVVIYVRHRRATQSIT